jgi:hypothetical protein
MNEMIEIEGKIIANSPAEYPFEQDVSLYLPPVMALERED